MSRPDANEWNVQGRPDHPDFWVLADLVLQADAAGESGTGEQYTREALGDDINDLGRIAVAEVQKVIDAAVGVPAENAGASAWMTGFSAGLRASRNEPPPSVFATSEEMRAAIFGGADETSVRYMAMQRSMRVLANGRPWPSVPDVDPLLAFSTLWIDGVVCGHQFDARKATYGKSD